MTKEEFLLDMLDYYIVDPEGRRCNSEAGCYYSPETIGKETSEGCAIGRKLDRVLANDLDSGGMSLCISDAISEYTVFPDYMYKLPIAFLSAIQVLHDKKENWDFENTGLSMQGVAEVVRIVKTYGLDLSKFNKCL